MSFANLDMPPLESGDRLTRDEFHRRYCARPDIKKAELVQGVVYVPSPVRARQHGKPHFAICGWLYAFAARTPDIEFAADATVFLDADTEVQPDALLFRPRPDGGASYDEQGYLHGAPDLVIEIAASSASYDLHDKLAAYERAGVPEYLAWRVLDRRIDWFHLRHGRYVPLEPDEQGIITSEIFPGLRLDVQALLNDDHAAVLRALDT
jgi:Uma2 family endonuclease